MKNIKITIIFANFIFMIMLCVFIVCSVLTVFAACENKEDEDLNGGVKPVQNYYLSYELIKDEYYPDEEVKVKLAYGTWMTKEERTGISDIFEDDFSVNVFALNEKDYDVSQSWKENPTKTLILKIENFYMENYPYPIKTVEAETTEIVFPKNLFVGDDGKIVILMDVYDEICCNIVYYQIKDDKICLRKEPEKNGDVIIVYAED